MSNDRAKIPFYNDLNFMIDNCEGLILDIWGVLWDGIKVYPEALTTLIELRKKDIPTPGDKVILETGLFGSMFLKIKGEKNKIRIKKVRNL